MSRKLLNPVSIVVVSSPCLPVKELRAARARRLVGALKRNLPAHLDLRERVKTLTETCTLNFEAIPPRCCEQSTTSSAPSVPPPIPRALFPPQNRLRSLQRTGGSCHLARGSSSYVHGAGCRGKAGAGLLPASLGRQGAPAEETRVMSSNEVFQLLRAQDHHRRLPCLRLTPLPAIPRRPPSTTKGNGRLDAAGPTLPPRRARARRGVAAYLGPGRAWRRAVRAVNSVAAFVIKLVPFKACKRSWFAAYSFTTSDDDG